MATASSWRTAGGPRMNNSSGNANHLPGSPNIAAAPKINNTNTHNGNSSNASRPNTDREQSETESIQRDRILYLLVGLVGNTVVATTKSGNKYIGILSSTSTPGEGSESLGVVLSCAQQIFKDGALGPLKKMLIINGDDLDGLVAKDVGLDVPVSMSASNRAGFRTDTEISKKVLEPFGEGRALQKWADDVEDLPLEAGSTLTGSASGSAGWDQFAANEARFGVKSNYEETLYTTKLDKSSKDFKEREKKAELLAREIMNSSTNNVHIAEERNLTSASDAQTEEDRYGAVVRGPNAYVPPAARRAAAAAAAIGVANSNGGAARQDKSNGAATSIVTDAAIDTPSQPAMQIPTITSTPAAGEGSSEVPKSVVVTPMTPTQHAPDAVGDFAHFVSSERERYEKKKAALAKMAQKEKESRLADLKSWGDKFKLKFPMSPEGTPLTSGGGAKMEGAEASISKDTSQKRELSGSVEPSPVSNSAKLPSNASASASKSPSAQMSEAKARLARMTIPKIPPYNPDKARAKQSEVLPTAITNKPSESAASPSPASTTASKSNFKLSAKASSFKPFNPNAAAFTPGAPSSTLSPSIASPNPASVKLPAPILAANLPPSNPFFGNRILKKSATLHVREDFNPFKNGKVPESQTVGPTWGFNGKGYRMLFQVIPAEDIGNNMGHLHQGQMTSPMNMPPVHGMMHMSHSAASMMSQGSSGPQQMQQPNNGHLPSHPQQQGLPQHHPVAPSTVMASNGQQFFMPYGAPGQSGPYRFQGQPMQHIPNAGYGQMPPQYMTFSPSMQQGAGPLPPPPPQQQQSAQMYSPQMGHMFPHSTSMHSMSGSPAQLGRSKGGPPPPPPMYYTHAPFMPMATANGASVGGVGGGGQMGPRSPGMRPQNSQSPQHMHPQQQQLQQLQPGHQSIANQQGQPPSQNSGASSQAGSTAGANVPRMHRDNVDVVTIVSADTQRVEKK